MKYTRSIALFVIALLASFLTDRAIAQAVPQLQNSAPGADTSFVAGRFVANTYNYTGAIVYSGNTSTGSASITVRGGYVVLPDSRNIEPFAVGVPIIIMDTTPELVTPTTVSGCYNARGMNQDGTLVTCTITASFSFTHGAGAQVQSGTNGLAEAVLDAFNWGGGIVTLAPGWSLGLNTSCTNCFASKDAAIAGLLTYPSVAIEDDSVGPIQLYTQTQSGSTILAAPTTLTAVTVGFGLNGANTTGGTYTGASTYHVCIAYVDAAGQEGPCSADFSALTAGSGSTNQIGIAAPVASAGAVGYTVYISLAAGTYNLTYQAPLTSTTCTLTKIETVTPACAVVNANYGQSGSNAVISALTVNTAPLHLLATTASTTSAYIGTPNGRTTYAYAPHLQVGLPGILGTSQAFTIASATATTVPGVIGTLNVPASFMNKVGRGLRVCGTATEAAAGSTATIENIELLWDAAGSNIAGAPVIVENLTSKVTLVTANADYISFCGDIQTTVASASVTGGSVMPIGGYVTAGSGQGGTQATGAGEDQIGAAVGSLNLNGAGGNTTRIHVVYNHTTGTDGAGMTLLGLSVQSL